MMRELEPIEVSIIGVIGRTRNEDELLLLSELIHCTRFSGNQEGIIQAFEKQARIHRIPVVLQQQTLAGLHQQLATGVTTSAR